MRIGAADGPAEEHAHKSTHVIYDTRSGHIVATYHVIGARPPSEQDHARDLLTSAHETSGVPLDHLALLTNPEIPHGEGEVRVDHAAKRLVSSGTTPLQRIRP
jgi:hypothetical protein